MCAPLNLKLCLIGICLLGFVSTTFTQVQQISFSNETDLLRSNNFSGVCMAISDMDGDGKDDIVRYNIGRSLNIEFQRGANQAFENQNVGPISVFPEWATAIADVDKNGYNDILVGGRYDNLKLIYNNDGTSMTSTNVPNSNIFVQGTNFVDIDNDGWVDIFSCDDDAESRKYLNDGSGSFTFDPRLIDTRTVPTSDNSGNYASAWIDYDNDDDLDLYISKCRLTANSATDPRRVNQLFRNNGNGSYTNVATQAGMAIGAQTWLTEFADVDNDGDLDAFVANHFDASQLMINDGNGRFTDVSAGSGLYPTLSNDNVFIVQAVFEDFNNDGYVDLMVSGTNHFLFYNNGDGTFSRTNPFGSQQIESFAIGDLNSDGFTDVYAGYANLFTDPSDNPDILFMNEGNNNNYLSVRLEGRVSNINGIGAKITVFGSSFGEQMREVRAGQGYGVQNTFTKTFGLGNLTRVTRIQVKWPSGILQTITNPQVNQTLLIREELPCTGNPCDDGNSCTVNDRMDENCECVGTAVDADNDGVCDSEDACPGSDDRIDSDNDGLPNGCDTCPNLDNDLIGQRCNDGDPCTTGERYDQNCNCTGGQLLDTDNDGVCNVNDRCPGSNDNIDRDNDNIPDGCDSCPTLDNRLIGRLCDDGDPCTTGETYDNNCNCTGGVIEDADNDGICAELDTDDSDPCIPNSAACGTPPPPPPPPPTTTAPQGCSLIDSTSFENNSQGVWIDGGANARIFVDPTIAASGTHSYYIHDNNGISSSIFTQPLSASGSNVIELFFSVFPFAVEAGDRFHLEIATDGVNYQIVDSYEEGSDFQDRRRFNESTRITGFSLSNATRLRLRSETNSSEDYFMLDDIVIRKCSEQSNNCTPGSLCNDGNPCTTGERFDANCNCTGGQFVDTDNDGICDSNDSCPNFNNALIGTPCDDGNPCTIGERYNASCDCAGGVVIDQDGDGFCSTQDPDDQNPCNPNASSPNCQFVASDGCTLINFTDFENDNLGIWTSGGASARIFEFPDNANSGTAVFFVRANQGAASSIISRPQDFLDASSVNISASILPFQTESLDQLVVESSNDGNNFLIHRAYTIGVDIVDGVRFEMDVSIDNIRFTSRTIFRIRAATDSDLDFFLIDDLGLEACSENCNVGSTCDDGNPCTIGERLDSDCNCTGGNILDTDNDGICDVEDTCPNFNNNLIGQLCNDGDPCTTGERFDNNCGCSGGTIVDNDGDGICSTFDSNDNDACVPNANNTNCATPSGQMSCIQLNTTSFENGDLGIWQDGGLSARLLRSPGFANTGEYSFYIHNNNGGASSLISRSQDFSAYDALRLSFHYYAFSVESGDRFVVEINNGSNVYFPIATYIHGRDFVNEDRIDINLQIDNINFTNNVSIRFRSICDSAADYFVLDDITLEGCANGGFAGCNIGASCDDNDPCTVGSTIDANCNCTGGTEVDNDGDGICQALDPNDNDECIPNPVGANCGAPGGGTTPTDCQVASFTGFENGNLGIWNDGGGSARLLNSSQFATTGNYSYYIHDNDGTQSSVFTDQLDLSNYQSIILSFNFFPYDMETGDRFHIEYSLNNSPFQILTSFVSGVDFNSEVGQSQSLAISGNFTSNTVLRFRAETNQTDDYIMLDDITIEVCDPRALKDEDAITTRSYVSTPEEKYATEEAATESDLISGLKSDITVYPNPANDLLFIDLEEDEATTLSIFDVEGRQVRQIQLNMGTNQIDISNLEGGQLYLLRFTSQHNSITKKLYKL